MARCERCQGRGSIIIGSTCHTCGGIGEISDYDDDGNEVFRTCPSCEYGLIFEEQACDFCSGTGQLASDVGKIIRTSDD
jgi:RecJ-like exonuclease